MTKKTEKVTVNRGADKVANAVAAVYDTIDNAGNVVTQCVTAARQVYKGDKIPKIDLSYIADNVARIRGWSPASLKQRKSEVRVILRAYDRLPDAINSYCRKADGFTWHDAVKLARCLGREPSQLQAVKLALAKNQPARQTPIKQIGSAVSRIMNTESRIARIVAFQTGLEALATQHDIDW